MSRLEQLGVFDGLFPFILVYVVVFAVLQKIELFGSAAEVRKYNAVIALVSAAAFVYPHYSGRYLLWGVPDPVVVINSAIPQIGIALIGVLLFLVLVGLVGFKSEEIPGVQYGAVIASILFVGYIFVNAAGWWNFPMLRFLNNPDLQFFLVFIIGLGLLIWFLSSGPSSGTGAATTHNWLRDLLQGPPRQPPANPPGNN